MLEKANADLKFGTSGLRGPASLLAGRPAFTYTAAFLHLLLERQEIYEGDPVFLARDLRASSPEIMGNCGSAAASLGLRPIDCGAIPTPALALAGMEAGAAAIMVTGSHIPADRNGLKFYRPDGEIDKVDEAEIAAAVRNGLSGAMPIVEVAMEARDGVRARYAARYREFFDPLCLAGLSIGVWQHSSVARDLIADILAGFGARVVSFGRSDDFVAVDTEAVRSEDRRRAGLWAKEHHLDAVVSADGDGDRPLVFDAAGNLVDGDLLGAIAARALNADIVVTPVSSNSGLESSGLFSEIRRCRVGSPFVIEEMERAGESGRVVVGFEGNGGVLLGSDITRSKRFLARLPTRDSLLPLMCCLDAMVREGRPLADIVTGFGFKAKATGLLAQVSAEEGVEFLAVLGRRGEHHRTFAGWNSAAATTLDGVRLGLGGGEAVHFRMSGNAAELRCYAEAGTRVRVDELLELALAAADDFINGSKRA